MGVSTQFQLIRQGVNSIPALRLLGETPDVVRTNLKAIVTLPVAHGGTEFGLNIVTGLAAARKYFLDLKRTGSPLDPTLFDDNVLDEWVEKTLTPDEPDDDESPKLAPFNVDDFMSFWDSLEITLKAIRGAQGAPLFYVIRPELPDGHDGTFQSEDERLIYKTQQNGREWNKDNRRVAQMVLEQVRPTDAYHWVRNVSSTDGKAIVASLVHHYEGGGHKQRIIELAQHSIDNLDYRNEAVFSWERFSTRMNTAYVRLEKHGIPTPLFQQLNTLRSKINTQNVEFNTLLPGVEADGVKD
eukprot:Nitzschia sp. Nitz4//scaffold49_size126201//72592//73485//NITZ4_003647-RA/size126201-processed-gene-0.99-mRNA-1//-1//CDS//3329553164//8707//frame0